MDKGSRTIVIVVAVIVLLAVVGYALGLFNVDASGDLKTPQVSVSGGEIPEVQVENRRDQRRDGIGKRSGS